MAKNKTVGSTMFVKLDGKIVEVKILEEFKSKGKSSTELCIIKKVSGGPEIQVERKFLIKNSPLLENEKSTIESKLIKEISDRDLAGNALVADLKEAEKKIAGLEEIIKEGLEANKSQEAEIEDLKKQLETAKK